MNAKVENNKVKISGKVVSGFTFSHEVFGEGFYNMFVEVQRLSDSTDTIPVMVSERVLDVNSDLTGKLVELSGQFRSYNQVDKEDSRKKKLILYVFVQDIKILEDEAERSTDEHEINSVELDGFICRDVIYRKTPLGREIADLLLAVNRPYGKSDYLPCICWGRNARYAESLETGTRLKVWGRIQSRTYTKKLDENNVENRVAYEVSVGKIEKIAEPVSRNQAEYDKDDQSEQDAE